MPGKVQPARFAGRPRGTGAYAAFIRYRLCLSRIQMSRSACSGLNHEAFAMRFYPTRDRPGLAPVAGRDSDDPIRKPENPLRDVLRLMLGMFAVFVAVWLVILLLTLGR